MTREELLGMINHYITKWQPILRLTEWNIKAGVVSADEINGSMAQIDHNDPLRWALIRVADPETMDKDVQVKFFDIESTVVHELCHLLSGDLCQIHQDALEQLAPSAAEMNNAQWERTLDQLTEKLAMCFISLKGGD